ncbi:MAG: cytochrome c biogenesis protein [Patescibacteria group bacterium]
MKKFIAVALVFLAILPIAVGAQAPALGDGQNVYYYSATCPHCVKVEEFFTQYNVLKQYDVIKREVSQNSQNAKKLLDLCLARGIPVDQIGVPYLHFDGQCFSGEQEIINFFKGKLGLNNTSSTNNVSTTQTATRMPIINNLTIPTVVVAALADSINPCAFSVMIFFLLSMIAIGARKRMLKVGLIYILVVYAVYLAAGLGLLAFIQSLSAVSRYILWIAAALAIVAGIVNIKDFFWYGRGFTLAIPESRKPIMEKYIKRASIPAAIILGCLVAIFELPCTGGFYLAILALLATKTTFITGFGYLVFYNIIFVLPLFIILLVVYKGVSPEKLETWRTAKRKWMRLVMGLVMVALGLALIFLF